MKSFIPLEYDDNAKSLSYKNLFNPDPIQEISYGNPYNALSIMKEMWELYWPYSDRNFLNELKNDFSQRYFEMYLAYHFLKMKIDLIQKTSGPDIQFFSNNIKIRIECVTPKNGDPSKADSLIDYALQEDNEAHTIQENRMIFRFLNALKDKSAYFQEFYGDNIDNGINIIAISGCELFDRYSDDYQCPFILKSVYPIGPLAITFDTRSIQKTNEYYVYEASIMKSNTASITKDFFMTNKLKHISGIIYSFVDIWNIKNIEDIRKELIYIENLHADVKFNPSIIGIDRKYIPIMEDNILKIIY